MNKLAKALGVSVLSLGVLSACGAEDATMSSAETGEKENVEQASAQGAKEEKKEENAEAVVEVKSETFGAYKDSIDNVYAYYGAEITNTGDKPARIGDIQINFESEDGSIVGTAPMVLSVPDIVMPGETAYIGEETGIDAVADAEEITNANVNIDFSSTEKEPMMLETENVKFTEGKDDYSNAYTVTGTVINPNENKADDVRLSAAFYDAEGNFLGVLNGSIMVSLNKDGKAGFELNYPELPKEVKGKAAEVKVKAYNWSF